ncbi:MAG: Fumarase C-terminus [Actinomycetota bacterium]|nr:Fumarase C-terminus [Actinomycetota bacterium]
MTRIEHDLLGDRKFPRTRTTASTRRGPSRTSASAAAQATAIAQDSLRSGVSVDDLVLASGVLTRERPDTILRPELGTSAGGELLGPPAS